MAEKFWETKSLPEMTAKEWESLCDGCAKCCLVKLQDEDTEEVFYTDIACRLLDIETCKCKDYTNRLSQVTDCVKVTVENIAQLSEWLPPSCAYVVLYGGGALPDSHPLVSGAADSMHKAGRSIAGRCISENNLTDDPEAHIVTWPQIEKNTGGNKSA